MGLDATAGIAAPGDASETCDVRGRLVTRGQAEPRDSLEHLRLLEVREGVGDGAEVRCSGFTISSEES